VQTLIANNCDVEKLQAIGSFTVEAIDYNAIRAADIESLEWMARQLNKPDEAEKWKQKADAIEEAIRIRMLDGVMAYDLFGANEDHLYSKPHAGMFITLFGWVLEKPPADALVEVLNSWIANETYPIATSPQTVNNFEPDRYWRGNVWISVNWLIWKGLRRYGFTDESKKIAKKSFELVAEHGFHEYFNPLTGVAAPFVESDLDLVPAHRQLVDLLVERMSGREQRQHLAAVRCASREDGDASAFR
jgi:glycogen debranching enzyme